VAHLYQARKQYRLVCERPNKGNKAIEREVISSYQVAQSLGFKGDFAPGTTDSGFTSDATALIHRGRVVRAGEISLKPNSAHDHSIGIIALKYASKALNVSSSNVG
jgi:hypothetical protein